MQRLAQLLPRSALRLPQAGSALARPSLLAVKQGLRTQIPFPSTSASVRFASDSYLSNNTLQRASNSQQTPEERWKEMSKESLESTQRGPDNAYSGRSISNTAAKNLTLTLKKLDSILSRNNVLKELRMTRRHEKKGEKRRRLKSQRWKNRFSNEVRLKVQLVNKIRIRGA